MFPPESINRIVSLAEPEVVNALVPQNNKEKNFLVYDKQKEVKRILPDYQKRLAVNTLTGLVDLMESASMGFDRTKVIVHVLSHTDVLLKAKSPDAYAEYVEYAHAVLNLDDGFQFNQYLKQEDFVIALRTLFVQTPAIDDLVAVAGNLAARSEVKQEDDGFTQTASMKAGVHMVQEKVIKPRVTLKPFRTFLEAVQPDTDAVFRIKDGGPAGITCALFSADGGNWRLAAMQNVKTWLTNRLRTSAVEGLGDIPVVA